MMKLDEILKAISNFPVSKAKLNRRVLLRNNGDILGLARGVARISGHDIHIIGQGNGWMLDYASFIMTMVTLVSREHRIGIE